MVDVQWNVGWEGLGLIMVHSILNWFNYIQRKIFFRATIFLYSPCPNLEGIKDALSKDS